MTIQTMFDIKIINGQVLDGTGAPPASFDVGITGDTITALGDLSAADSRITLDLDDSPSGTRAAQSQTCPAKLNKRSGIKNPAERDNSAFGGTKSELATPKAWTCPAMAGSKIISPGFIDAHSHSDTYLLIEPSAHSKIYQGITTEVVGNCGVSAAPLTGDCHLPGDWLEKEYPGQWETVAEYRALLEKVRPAPNVMLLIGHKALRVAVAGYDNRQVTDSELRKMVRMLERSLDEGGRGLSTGLIYAPGMFASREELVELAKTAARYDGIYTSHIRNEGKYLLEAIEEAVSIGKDAGIRVEISHLKTSGCGNWGLVDQALDFIRKAKTQGVDVAADRYPYTSGYTDLDIIFPEWAAEGGREAVLRRVRNSSERARLRADLLKSKSDDYWETVVIGSTSHPDNMKFQGMPLREVAEQLGMDPVDAVLYFAESDELKTSAFFFGMSEDNMMKIFGEPYVMICTDASLRAPTGPLSHDHPHPRAYGSFPRFLRMALDGKTVSLPEAVRKMTSLPAKQFRLTDRGVIAKSMKADIVIFDPQTVRDMASYTAPHQLSEGIEHVIVNGVPTLQEGLLTGNRAGRFLS